MGGLRLRAMAKGETVMPIPGGIISTSEGPVDPEKNSEVEEAIEEALPEATEEE